MFNNYKIHRLCAAVLVAITALGLLSGCQEPIDSDIGTGSIHAAMLLTSTGDGTTRVVVTLSSSSGVGADIFLTDSDGLVATANGQSQSLREERLWPRIIRYFTVFDFDDSGTEVTVSFERSNYVPAPDSTIVLPAEIVIQTPQAGETFARQESITVSWEPAGGSDQIAIKFATLCQSDDDYSSDSKSFTVSDSGSVSYTVEELLSEQDVDASATCTTDITLKREVTGSLSAEYKGGTMIARREASVSVKIAPLSSLGQE